ncbi:hypothetical protein GCM10022252_09640 [Streptosporangium oxazolinicum]|uniref:Excisionase n=1 Tax=Streptosporangium oxazolinicum TaxID=909287 RepID=A0ABP8AF46_9ACTN
MTPLPASAKTLREEFPRWALRESGAHRHWAIRTDRPTTPQIKVGAKLYLSRETITELAERLRAEERLLAEVTP